MLRIVRTNVAKKKRNNKHEKNVAEGAAVEKPERR